MAANEQPLDRTLAVLQAVSGEGRAISITEVAQICGLPVPTVHRIASQLEKRSLLKRAIGSRKLLVGPGLLRLGAAAMQAATRSDSVHELLVALAAELGEHCQLGTRLGNEIIYSDTVRAARSTGLHFEQGRRAPLYCSSIGKLFLAEMSSDEFRRWLSTHPREAMTSRTLVTERALKVAVKAVRDSGWAMSDEEMAVGVIGCAVPVRLSDGNLVGGLGISVPSPRMSFDALRQFRPAMERTAAGIVKAIEAT